MCASSFGVVVRHLYAKELFKMEMCVGRGIYADSQDLDLS